MSPFSRKDGINASPWLGTATRRPTNKEDTRHHTIAKLAILLPMELFIIPT
jgi:hypothetical protein